MSGFEKVILWVGIISLAILVTCFILYIWYKRKADNKNHNKQNNKSNTKSVQNFEAKTYTSNERLDGARVSHRRSHPDRIDEENIWKELKERENSEIQKKLELDRKNKLLMIFSPCNAEVVSTFENIEEAIGEGYHKPGVVLVPNDDKIYAPMNGVISWDENSKILHVKSDTGTEVIIEVKYKANDTEMLNDCFEMKVRNGSSICMGELIGQFQTGLIKKNNRPVVVHLELSSYKANQLILMKRANYVSHGDKVLTIRLES